MAPDVALDPFVVRHDPQHDPRPELDTAWFDAPRSVRALRTSSVPPRSPSKGPPPLPIDDPIADRWFR